MDAKMTQIREEKKWKNKLEYYRYGIFPLVLIVQSMLGSVAVFFIFQMPADSQIVPLTIVTIFIMGANAIGIAQASVRWILFSFFLAVGVSVLTIVYALLHAA